jgi:hypothetical protein
MPYKLVATTVNKQCEENLLTACEQTCGNLFANLLQAVCFYACIHHGNKIQFFRCPMITFCIIERKTTQAPSFAILQSFTRSQTQYGRFLRARMRKCGDMISDQVYII